MKSEDYEAIAFVFVCLALAATVRWCDREHERAFPQSAKGGAANFDKSNLDE